MFLSPRRATAALAAAALAAAGVVAFAAPAAAASGDLLISEYVEGSSNNKAVEIYNPSTAAVDLVASGYSLQQYSNGSLSAGLTIPLTGSIAAGDVFVLSHGAADPAILAIADQVTATNTGMFNGDDAVALVKNGVIVDVFGQIGVDPGTEWGTGLTSTADNTLRRAATTCVGDENGADAFDPAAGWVGFATNTFDGLGSHDATCALEPPTDPDPGPVADCVADATPIGTVQGNGSASPVQGTNVMIRGVVVGDFQVGGFDGYYVQDAGDGDPATSDGVFVYAPGGTAVSAGDLVSVAGSVKEQFGLTEVVASDVEICATGQALPAATPLTLPATTEQREALEGMYVTLPQQLTIGETFEYGRFGTITLTVGRQDQPTAVFEPGSAEASALAAANIAGSITLDDGRGAQNPDPAIHPNGEVFSLTNTFRSGDFVTDATGVLDYRFDVWGVQPTQGADFAVGNPRPEVPEVGGDLKLSSFNVLNYFTSIDPTPTNSGDDDYYRGADTAEEFQRQQSKIVSALAEIDADVFGLLEIENNGTAVQSLADALNAVVGAGTYVPVTTGVIGTDAITTAILYKPAAVQPVGDFLLMTSAVDPAWDDDRNRPALTQTFASTETGEEFTLSVNHLKSKGSACSEDPDQGDGQGNCNGVRTAAATALATWLNETVSPDGRAIIMGDLNSYDHEDPIDAFVAGGFTDLEKAFNGEHAYSYVFDGQLGYLDYALAGQGITEDVTGVSAWHINADEPSLIDYDMSFKAPAQDALWAPDPFRSSDHDPVIIGLALTPPDTTAPTLEVTADPSTVWPPNNKMRSIEFTVDAADESGDVTVELTDVTVSGSSKAEWEQTGDHTFAVKAVKGAVYTFTWTATDAAGNTSTDTVEVVVGR